MIKRFFETIYDAELLPCNKDNLANYITLAGVWLSRLSLYLFFVVLAFFLLNQLVLQPLRYVAIGLAILASISDGIDGYIARKYECTSDFGKIFDPHHDKIQYLCKTTSLVIDAFLVYMVTGQAEYFVFAIMLKYITGERDETVGFHRLWAATVSRRVKLSARMSGKWRTRIAFAGFPLLHLLISPIGMMDVFIIVSLTIVFVTSYSLFDYVRGYRDAIKEFYRKKF